MTSRLAQRVAGSLGVREGLYLLEEVGVKLKRG